MKLASRAERELLGLGRQHRTRLVTPALRTLEKEPWPENLALRQLEGKPGWWRLRVGDYRILFSLREQEQGEQVILVARIIHRRDLKRAVRSLY